MACTALCCSFVFFIALASLASAGPCLVGTCAEAGQLCYGTVTTTTLCQDSYCKSGSPSSTVCASLIPNGGACGRSPRGSPSISCVSGFCGYNGYCMDFGAEKSPGQSCTADYECAFYAPGTIRNSTCVNGKCFALQLDAECNSDYTQCDVTSLYCGGISPNRTCTPYQKVGENCTSDVQCAPPAQCNGKGRCANLLTQGSTCDAAVDKCVAGTDCVPEVQNGPAKCVPLFSVKAGGYCDDNDHCADFGLCNNRVCTKPTAYRNQTCLTNSECLSTERCACQETGPNSTIANCFPFYNSDYVSPDLLDCFTQCQQKNFLSNWYGNSYFDGAGYQKCLTSTCSKGAFCSWYKQGYAYQPRMSECQYKVLYGPFVDKCGSASSITLSFVLLIIALFVAL